MPKYMVRVFVNDKWVDMGEWDMDMDAWGVADVVAHAAREDLGAFPTDIDMKECE